MSEKSRKWGIPVFLILFCFSVQIAELGVDLPFILNAGRWISDGNGFFTKDVFSMHTEYNFRIQQWFFCYITHYLHEFGGLNALRLFSGFSMAVGYYMIYKICTSFKLPRQASLLVLMLCIPLMTYFAGAYRPYLISVPLFLLETYLLLQYKHNGDVRYICCLPLLGVVMINCHAAYFLFLFIVIAPFFAEFLFKNRRKCMYLGSLSVLMFFCGIFNPYGLDMIWYPLKGVSEHSRYVIEEMSRLWDYPHLYLWSIFILGVVVFIYALIDRKCCISSYLFLGGSLVLNLYAIKLNDFLVVAMIVLFCDMYKNGCFKPKLRRIVCLTLCTVYVVLSLVFLTKAGLMSMAVFLSMVVFMLIYLSGYHVFIWLSVFLLGTSCIKKYQEIAGADLSFCVGRYVNLESSRNAVRELGKLEPNVYCAYNVGAYFEMFGCKSFLDTRAELFMKSMNGCDDLLEKYYYAMTNRDFSYIEDYDFDYAVLVNTLNNVYELNYFVEHSGNWEMVYADDYDVTAIKEEDFANVNMFIFKYIGE